MWSVRFKLTAITIGAILTTLIVVAISVELSSKKSIGEALEKRAISYTKSLSSDIGFAVAAGMLDEVRNLSNSFLEGHPEAGGITVVGEDNDTIISGVGEEIQSKTVKALFGKKGEAKKVISLNDEYFKCYLVPIFNGEMFLGHLIYIESQKEMDSLLADQRKTLLLVYIVVLVTMGIVMTVFGGRFSDPLKQMAQLARNVANGDLSKKEISIRNKDEVGQLAKAINEMAEALSRQVGAIKDTADSVLNNTSSVSKITSDLASSTNEQAEHISDVVALTAILKGKGGESKRNASRIVDMAGKSVDYSNEGLEAVSSSLDENVQIRDQVLSITSRVEELVEELSQVYSIIATVEEIAGQSNLLAINASIEAAKAGKIGRGFSVVAKQVKTLSKQSRQATVEVTDTLSRIQAAIDAVASSARIGGDRAESGVKSIESTGQVILRLTETISQTSDAAKPITAGVQDQFATLDEIEKVMNGVKSMALSNLKNSQYVESSIKELNIVAVKLEGLVSNYRIN